MNFTTKQFAYDKANQLFSADLSNIGKLGETCFGGITGNRVGITMMSAATGNVAEFALRQVKWDERNQIESWHLEAMSDGVGRGTKCVIYNK